MKPISDLPPRAERTHTLYRLYDDAGGLLYIGLTTAVRIRFQQHARQKPWWKNVVGYTVETFQTATALREAEAKAISTEGPRHNKQLGRDEWPPPLTVAERANRRRIIECRRDEGATFDAIAAELGISLASVYRALKDPDEIRAERKRYRRQNPEAQQAARRRWRERNAERIRTYQREWRAQSRESVA